MTCITCRAKLDPRIAIRGQWCGAPCYPPLDDRTRGGWHGAIPLTSVANFRFERKAA